MSRFRRFAAPRLPPALPLLLTVALLLRALVPAGWMPVGHGGALASLTLVWCAQQAPVAARLWSVPGAAPGAGSEADRPRHHGHGQGHDHRPATTAADAPSAHGDHHGDHHGGGLSAHEGCLFAAAAASALPVWPASGLALADPRIARAPAPRAAPSRPRSGRALGPRGPPVLPPAAVA